MVVAYSTFKQAGTWSDIIIQDLEKVGCSNYRGSTDGERSRSTLDNHGHIQYLRQYKKYKCEGNFLNRLKQTFHVTNLCRKFVNCAMFY